MFSLVRRRLREDLITIYKCLKCGSHSDRDRFYSVVRNSRTRVKMWKTGEVSVVAPELKEQQFLDDLQFFQS